MIHIVKGFSIVNEADVFLESLAFAMIQQLLAIWFLVSLHFLNLPCILLGSWFTYCWSLAWRILSIILPAFEMSAIVWLFEHSLAFPFFGIGMKTHLFQTCDHCWVFQICWLIDPILIQFSGFHETPRRPAYWQSPNWNLTVSVFPHFFVMWKK